MSASGPNKNPNAKHNETEHSVKAIPKEDYPSILD